MIGNDAIGLGAYQLALDYGSYPITPASEIMEYMIENLPKVMARLFKLKMKL